MIINLVSDPFQEGSIGSDIVIRPIPPRLLNAAASSSKKAKANGQDEDDEMFLDSDGELNSEVAIDTGLPIKRKTQVIQGQQHIVYKRTGNQEDTMSDYGMF